MRDENANDDKDHKSTLNLPLHEVIEPLLPEVIVMLPLLVPGPRYLVQLIDSLKINL